MSLSSLAAMRFQLSRLRNTHRLLLIKQHHHQLHTSPPRYSSMTSAFLAAVTVPTNPAAQPSDIKVNAHHEKNGKGFVNPWPSYKEFGPMAFFQMMIRKRISGEWKEPDTTTQTIPVLKPEFLPTRRTPSLRATWLGHACYYIEFPSGMRVLFDPVFTDRCSPFSFMGPKRYTEMPCRVEDIPYIDAVVISHNHYDHLSHPTLQTISEKFPNAHFFVPLGNKPWFKHMKLPDHNVTEMDWWEERTLTLSSAEGSEKQEDISATVSCLPCQHTSARTAFDKARTLWASWSVSSGGNNIWLGGDTGYRTVPELAKDEFDYGEKYADLPVCPAFKQIGQLRGPFDLGLIPIGAYDPRYFMSPVHANPYDGVNIFSDTQCKRALGIHWGTWVLTPEDVMEPKRVLKKALKWKGLPEAGVFETCDIGESREY
jgi:N-acyl-phosphatidylethanolamine-hydrolysing phospholipase D